MLTIKLTQDQIAAAVATSPRAAFYAPDQETPCTVTVDPEQLAVAVLDALRRTDDTGRTPIHAMIDDATQRLLDRGAPGLSIEHVTER